MTPSPPTGRWSRRRRAFLRGLGLLALPLLLLHLTAADPESTAVSVPVDEQNRVRLRLPDLGIFDAVAIYEKLTGKNVIIPTSSIATGKISLMAPDPLPLNEAAELITSALLINGYALVPGDGNRVRLVPVSASNPRAVGLPICTGSPDTFPKDCPIVTYFMPFKNLTAPDAFLILSQQVALNQPYGSIVSAPNAQALLITENVSVIRQLINIQKLIDVPPAEMNIEFVQLHNANAADVVETMKSMLTGGVSGTAATKEGLKMSVEGSAGGPASKGLVKMNGNERILPDPRTNRVMVAAGKDSLGLLVGIVKKLDEAALVGDPKEYHLRFVAATELLPILADALSEQGKNTNAQSTAIAATVSTGSGGSGGSGVNDITTGTGGGSGTAVDVSSQVHVSEESSRALSLVVGKTKLIADNRTNTMVIVGPPQSWQVAERILKIMDQPPKQVYLATLIGQMSNDGTQELGIDLLQASRGSKDNYASSVLNTFPLAGPTDPRGVQVNGPTLASVAQGWTVFGTVGTLFNYYVKLLQQTNRFTILSRPSVYTSNNKKAIIASGTQQPVPGTTQSNVVGGTTTNNTSTVLNTSVEYKDILLQLAVVPLINANNDVTLQIAQSNDTLGNSVPIGSVNATAINKQSLNTTITVRNGETVVLGGLLTERESLVRVGIPFLSDIPLLGYLFSDTVSRKTKTELIILIQPIVISSLDGAVLQSDIELDRTKVGPKALEKLDPPPPSEPAIPIKDAPEELPDPTE